MLVISLWHPPGPGSIMATISRLLTELAWLGLLIFGASFWTPAVAAAPVNSDCLCALLPQGPPAPVPEGSTPEIPAACVLNWSTSNASPDLTETSGYSSSRPRMPLAPLRPGSHPLMSETSMRPRGNMARPERRFRNSRAMGAINSRISFSVVAATK